MAAGVLFWTAALCCAGWGWLGLLGLLVLAEGVDSVSVGGP
jgi:hypothetical protein